MKDLTNIDRAGFAQQALAEFQRAVKTDDCDALADLLADLMHWCDQFSEFSETFTGALDRAILHHDVEKELER